MSDPISNTNIYADFQQFNDIRLQAKHDSSKALVSVAKQFEAIFVQMAMKSMREANEALGESLFHSNSMKFYESMFDKQLSMDIAAGGGLGFADMIVEQMDPNKRPIRRDVQFPVQLKLQTEESTPALTNTGINSTTKPAFSGFGSPDDFVKQLLPFATQAAKRLGVSPKVLLAQSALETGWGKSIIKATNGESSFNLFNIKADRNGSTDKIAMNTLEYRNGRAEMVRDYFRSYPSFQESFNDYEHFLKSNARYQTALEHASDPKLFVQELQNSGYATDPNYAKKIERIMESDVFNRTMVHL